LKAPFIDVETIVYCLLVETSSGPVLIDTGFGTQDYLNPSRKMRFFLRWMGVPNDPKETAVYQARGLGFEPEDVQNIILTHMHVDHAGGLVDFPWANVHIYETEYQAIQKPKGYMEVAYIPQHWQHGPRWVRHDDPVIDWFGFKAIPILNTPEADFFFIPLPGHTRGHCGIAIGKPGKWLLHCGDAASTFHEGSDLHNRGEEAHKLKFLPNWLAESIMGSSLEPLLSLLEEYGDEVKAISAHDVYSFREYNNLWSSAK